MTQEERVRDWCRTVLTLYIFKSNKLKQIDSYFGIHDIINVIIIQSYLEYILNIINFDIKLTLGLCKVTCDIRWVIYREDWLWICAGIISKGSIHIMVYPKVYNLFAKWQTFHAIFGLSTFYHCGPQFLLPSIETCIRMDGSEMGWRSKHLPVKFVFYESQSFQSKSCMLSFQWYINKLSSHLWFSSPLFSILYTAHLNSSLTSLFTLSLQKGI